MVERLMREMELPVRTYTAEETQAFHTQGKALGDQIKLLVESDPKVAWGQLIHSVAYLLASKARDREHAEGIAKDVAVATMALFNLRG